MKILSIAQKEKGGYLLKDNLHFLAFALTTLATHAPCEPVVGSDALPQEAYWCSTQPL